VAKTGIGVTVIRKEAFQKVTGDAKYTADYISAGVLTAKAVTSTCSHALIKNIDITAAVSLPGVKAVITGESFPILCGPLLEDRYPLAFKKVRYYGEPVALVVANDEFTAEKAVLLIKVNYESLPSVNSPSDALKPGAPILHEDMGSYKTAVQDIYPEPGTNICDRKKIRKGDIEKGFSECDVVSEARFVLPQSDHIAMETRAAQAKINADGTVFIRSASQSPFEIKKKLGKVFGHEEGKIVVETPLVGGAFGGKTPVQLELLAYIASKAAGGREVRIVNTRENDIVSSPCRMGLEATVKMGTTRNGKLKAAQITYLVDTGAYSDIGPRLTKALAVDCTGPIKSITSGAIPCAFIQIIHTRHPSGDSDTPAVHFV
jgi:CO/xanthine dehydrogenase Mo-binding subunit